VSQGRPSTVVLIVVADAAPKSGAVAHRFASTTMVRAAAWPIVPPCAATHALGVSPGASRPFVARATQRTALRVTAAVRRTVAAFSAVMHRRCAGLCGGGEPERADQDQPSRDRGATCHSPTIDS
jgi:hypothetical protein